MDSPMSRRAVFKSKVPNYKPAAAQPLRDLAEAQRTALVKVTGTGKYGSKRCTVQGEAFDSKAEARRWLELVDMQRRGLITGLIRQPRFPLEVNGADCGNYYADFQYYTADGVKVVEDVKAKSGVTCTQVYKLKKRLVAAIHGIYITEHFV
jgi:hypothetical protein